MLVPGKDDVRVIAAHRVRGTAGAPRITTRQRVCGSVTIWTIETDAAEYQVQPEPDDDQFFTFAFIESGRVLSKFHDEPWRNIGPSLVIAPEGLERRLRFEGTCRLTVAKVPKSAIAGFVTELPGSARVLEDQRLLDRALLAFLTAVMDAEGEGSAIDRYAIEHLVLEMCGAILLDRLGTVWAQGNPAAALRDRALAVIAQQCEDSDLTPERVAKAVQSSLRHLQSLFADAGTTVAGEIRRHRARLARATLLDSRYDVLSVEQVAQRSGFRNTMSLRRALHEIYGTGPRELRRCRGGEVSGVAQGTDLPA
ncbi:helix-turn-helix domain-containing protein [Microbacterium sp.]|uniref:helix-turn-helix domain-containing protein n=1 Tax=Microbacterium sp. TaxID=51671 RepID=UPI0028122F08|nr:helix-turn-helix domain-containing protein [Microbacterium sp.]